MERLSAFLRLDLLPRSSLLSRSFYAGLLQHIHIVEGAFHLLDLKLGLKRLLRWLPTVRGLHQQTPRSEPRKLRPPASPAATTSRPRTRRRHQVTRCSSGDPLIQPGIEIRGNRQQESTRPVPTIPLAVRPPFRQPRTIPGGVRTRPHDQDQACAPRRRQSSSTPFPFFCGHSISLPSLAICANRTLSDSYARNSSDFTADSEQLSTSAICAYSISSILVHHHRGPLF